MQGRQIMQRVTCFALLCIAFTHALFFDRRERCLALFSSHTHSTPSTSPRTTRAEPGEPKSCFLLFQARGRRSPPSLTPSLRPASCPLFDGRPRLVRSREVGTPGSAHLSAEEAPQGRRSDSWATVLRWMDGCVASSARRFEIAICPHDDVSPLRSAREREKRARSQSHQLPSYHGP